MFSFTFYAKFLCISNTAIFVQIFMNFSPKVELRNWKSYTPLWEVFVHFSIGKGPIFGPKSGLAKSLHILGHTYEGADQGSASSCRPITEM